MSHSFQARVAYRRAGAQPCLRQSLIGRLVASGRSLFRAAYSPNRAGAPPTSNPGRVSRRLFGGRRQPARHRWKRRSRSSCPRKSAIAERRSTVRFPPASYRPKAGSAVAYTKPPSGQRHEPRDRAIPRRRAAPVCCAPASAQRKNRRPDGFGPVGPAPRPSAPVRGPGDLAEAAARQTRNIRRKRRGRNSGTVRDINIERIAVSEGDDAGHPARRLPSRDGLPARSPGSLRQDAGRHRTSGRPRRNDAAARIPRISQSRDRRLGPCNRCRRTTSCQSPVSNTRISVRTGETCRDVTPIRRPGEPVDGPAAARRSAAPADPSRSRTRRGCWPSPTRTPVQPPATTKTPVRRDGDGKELALGAGADCRPQHLQLLAGRQRPQPHRLVEGRRRQQTPAGIDRRGSDRRGVHAGFQAQHRRARSVAPRPARALETATPAWQEQECVIPGSSIRHSVWHPRALIYLQGFSFWDIWRQPLSPRSAGSLLRDDTPELPKRLRSYLHSLPLPRRARRIRDEKRSSCPVSQRRSFYELVARRRAS